MELSQPDLEKIAEAVASQLLACGGIKTAPLPVLYAFPEDIFTILRGKVKESTIRAWKTKGYLRTEKIGIRSFVTPEDWQWFRVNHKELMTANSTHPSKEKAQ